MRFDSRMNDKVIEEISRRKCRPGQRWDPVNQVCRGYGGAGAELGSDAPVQEISEQ